MDIYIKIVASLALIVFGVAVDRFWIHRKRGEIKSSVNAMPNSMVSEMFEDELSRCEEALAFIANNPQHYQKVLWVQEKNIQNQGI